jgi:hypothetical protein
MFVRLITGSKGNPEHSSKKDPKSFLPKMLSTALSMGWITELADDIAGKKRADPVKVKATDPSGNLSRTFEIVLGATPYCPLELRPIEEIFTVAIDGKYPMRLARWAQGIVDPEAEVVVYVKCDHGELQVRAPLKMTPFIASVERVRVGKTERDHASETRGNYPTGHSAVPGPAKGHNPPAWNGMQGRGGKKKDSDKK